jgi:serine/threonine protein kinase
LGGNTISHETKTLTVTSVIRTGYGRGAQLVVVNEDTVAKIYDPLYYEYTNDFDIKQDIVYDADGDYSREASAYIELQKSTAASKVVPAYHGTWTIDIDVIVRKGETPQKCTRRVPLILMEYLRGQPMVNIEVDSLSQRIQSQVLREVLDAEAVIYHAGIDHRDFLPRNIMITGVDKGDEPSCLVVKVFDFNCSTVLGHPRYRDRQYIHQTNKLLAKWHPKLLNPIVRWYGQMNELSVPGWCSARYAEQWLWEQYHDDERYIPVVWDPSNPDTRPQYAEFESGSEKSVDSGLDLDSAVEKGEECGDMSGLGSADHIALAIQSS